MELLELGEDKMVTISTTISSISEFKKLIKRDKDRYKKTAIAEVTFIYHWLNPKSPLFNYKKDDKLFRCIKNAGLDASYDYTRDIDVLAAINFYNDYLDNQMPSLSLYRSTIKAADKLKDFLDTIPLKDASDAASLLNIISKVGAASQSLKNDYNKLKEELSLASGLRGQAKKGRREDPNSKLD